MSNSAHSNKIIKRNFHKRGYFCAVALFLLLQGLLFTPAFAFADSTMTLAFPAPVMSQLYPQLGDYSLAGANFLVPKNENAPLQQKLSLYKSILITLGGIFLFWLIFKMGSRKNLLLKK